MQVPASRTVDWDTWFYAPGMPPVTNEYDTSLASQAYDLAMKWHTCDVMGIGSEYGRGAPGVRRVRQCPFAIVTIGTCGLSEYAGGCVSHLMPYVA